jgi:hypothetical protein
MQPRHSEEDSEEERSCNTGLIAAIQTKPHVRCLYCGVVCG